MPKLKLVTILGTRPEIIRLAEIIKIADKVLINYKINCKFE